MSVFVTYQDTLAFAPQKNVMRLETWIEHVCPKCVLVVVYTCCRPLVVRSAKMHFKTQSEPTCTDTVALLSKLQLQNTQFHHYSASIRAHKRDINLHPY